MFELMKLNQTKRFAMISMIVSLMISTFVCAEENHNTNVSDNSSVSTIEFDDFALSSKKDTLICGDTIIVVHTVCAPICSSCARVYNKDWNYLGPIIPPIQTAFPEAYIEDGKLFWRDNDKCDYTPVP